LSASRTPRLDDYRLRRNVSSDNMVNLQRRLMRVGTALNNSLHRASGGRVRGQVRGLPVLLITVAGRKTKRQASKAGIGWTALVSGSASCEGPDALQRICDRLGPANLQRFCDRWLGRLPLPLIARDRANGYWWELSMRQVEVARTMVFDVPRNGRAFFEALVADNLDLGPPRADRVDLRQEDPAVDAPASLLPGSSPAGSM
jgi:hypothetical protein